MISKQNNLQLFTLFRVFFNCRFYYPIFAILFLDFGLSLEDFSKLNFIWALTIVLAEVPSGALADLFGRKKLLIIASSFMILELSFLSFAPRNSEWIFYILAFNRIFSGLAEAAASGADEALAYDSLSGSKKEKDQKWSDTLAKTMKAQSIFMVVAMLLGAFLYDHELLEKITSWKLNRDFTLRIPSILCLLSAITCLWISNSFKEIKKDSETIELKKCKKVFKESFR